MATPLVQLLRGVIDDPAVRAEFADGPMDFLSRHGYEHLDAADVREALMIMADGAPTSEATQLHTGGEAIDSEGGDGLAGAATGLGSALGAITAADVDIDPADLDGLDDLDSADDVDDESVAADTVDDSTDETAGPGETSVGDALFDTDELAAPATGEPAPDEPALDEPALDEAPFASQPDSTPDDIDGSDEWDDLL